MSKTSENLGKRIRQLRNLCGISQEELAFKAHISTTYLGQLERAEKSPTVDILDRISNALEISLCDLFNFEHEVPAANSAVSLNKINAQLSSLSEKELAEILKLIRNVKAFKNA